MIGNMIRRSIIRGLKLGAIMLCVQLLLHSIRIIDITAPFRYIAIGILYFTNAEMNAYIATPVLVAAFLMPAFLSSLMTFMISLIYEVQKARYIE